MCVFKTSKKRLSNLVGGNKKSEWENMGRKWGNREQDCPLNFLLSQVQTDN